jgi:hypothetical protein
MRSPLTKVAKSIAAVAAVFLGVTAGTLTSASAQTRVAQVMPKSVPPNPNFKSPGECGTSGVNDTSACNTAIVKAINAARKSLALAALPADFSVSAFDALNDDQQIMTMADIERSERGLPTIAGLTSQLNGVALAAAKAQRDPAVSLPVRLTGGGSATDYGSNFAEGTADGMGADYYWMYDDGLNSPNSGCTPSNETGCWGHRTNILAAYSSAAYCPKGSADYIVMGDAEQTTGVLYDPAITEIFTNDCGALPTMDFTWAQAQKLVFGT